MKNDPRMILADSPMSAMQIIAVALCILLNALDGFDVLSISFAAPGISSEWGIDRAALGVVLSMELIGMGLGSITLGNFADKFGRRPTVLGSLIVMALGMLAAGRAGSIVDLSVYRFLTGLGIGGMLASASAMTAEFSNARYRNMAVILFAGGYAVGAVVGGAVASGLLKAFDWRAVFYFGSIATAVFAIFIYFLLPESISFLVHKRPKGALEKINRILTRMKHEQISEMPPMEKEAPSTGLRKLFSSDLRRPTLLLTLAYFCHIMTFYFFVKWIPKIVVDLGFAASAAGGVLVWANVGGTLGSVLIGMLSHRYSVRALLMTVLVGSSISVGIFGRGPEEIFQLSMLAGVAGFFLHAAIVCLYAMLAQAFPTEARASGTGFVIGVGRGGAVLGPIAAGLLFSSGYGLQSVAIMMGSGCLIGVIALYFLKPKSTSWVSTEVAQCCSHAGTDECCQFVG